MSEILTLRILLLALEALAASAILPAAAWLASLTFKRRANLRHLVWLSAFGALLALPLLAAVTPGQIMFQQVAHPLPPAPVMTVAATVGGQACCAAIGLGGIVKIGIAIWALGVAALALQGLVATIGLRRLRERSVLHETPVGAYSQSLSGGQAWELRLSSLCNGPMTWGVARPVVLLPWEAHSWAPARLKAVLLHELAHVRRRDSLSQTLAQIACALYWPNPLVWMAASALRKEAEIAADDSVIASGVRPSDYAGELVSLAGELRQQRLAFAGLAMAAPSALSERVDCVLSPTPVRKGVNAVDIGKIAGVALLATTALALARPGIAETRAAPITTAELPPAAPAPLGATAMPPLPPLPPKPAKPEPGYVDEAAIQVRIDQALAQAETARRHAEEASMQALNTRLQAQQARVQAEVTRATADIDAKVRKQIEDEKIEEKVAQRLAEIQPKIDAALAKARAAAERAHDVSNKPTACNNLASPLDEEFAAA